MPNFYSGQTDYITELNKLATATEIAAVGTKLDNIDTSVASASTSATNAAASYDAFDDRYLGSKAANPTLDNDGVALLTGAIYWNTAIPEMRVWTGTAWVAVQSTSAATNAAASASTATTQATNAAASYDAFDDRYLGSKATNPTLDNDGVALLVSAIYWNTAIPEMRVWTGTAWVAVQSTSAATNAAASASTATTQATNAAASATTASTQATNAAASATTATTQATNASASATTASTQATNASASASTATTQATNASASATTASTQATNAAASASTATTQATNAAASATTASTQATNASASASTASTQATNAASSATTAANYLTIGTSTTSVLIGLGSKSFTTTLGKAWGAGQFLSLTSAANSANYMHGAVTSYNSGTGALVMNILDIEGSGTLADWNIAISGTQGPIGATGAGSGTVTSVTGALPIQVVTGTSTPVISINAATGAAAGSMSATDFTKLAGVATSATANSTDAILLARANHTGAQAISTVTGLQIALDGKLATTGVAVSSSTLTSDDTRAVNNLPSAVALGVKAEFKANTTTSIVDSGTYHSLINVKSYPDFSGGEVKQIALTDSNNLWMRTSAGASAWGAWKKFASNKVDVGLGNVDNTSDASKPVSTAQATANALAQPLAGKDASGGYAGLTLFQINFKNALNTITSFFTNANTVARTYTFQDRDGTIADNTDLALKANLANPTFTGTIGGITSAMVGLGNVNNTSDASKPVSTAQQAALDLKTTASTLAAVGGGALVGNVAAAGVTEATAQGAINGLEARKVDKVTTLGGAVDLNTVATSGFYRLSSPHVNMPVGLDDSAMLVSRSGNTCFQQIVAYITGKTYTRAGNGATALGPMTAWTAWSESANLDTVQTFTNKTISNTPAGGIAATTVQGAINELDLEKVDKGAVQAQSHTAVTTVGSSTAYSVATLPVQPSLVSGQRYRIKLHTPNGAAPTLVRDGLAAAPIRLYNVIGAKVAPAANALPTLFDVEYDGVDYVVLNPLPATGGATGAAGETVFVENSRVMNTSYTLSTGKSASMVGPLIIATGAALTVPTNQRLVIL